MWTNDQIKRMHIRCKSRDIDEPTRRMMLRQLPNAFFDRDGRPTREPSSTSKKLNNQDYDRLMSWISGDDIDPHHRERYKARQLLEAMRSGDQGQGPGAEGRMDVRAWEAFCARQIKRVTTIDAMTGSELYKVIEGLKAIGKKPRRARKADNPERRTRNHLANHQQPATNNQLRLVPAPDDWPPPAA